MKTFFDKTFKSLLENRFLNRWTILVIDIFIILFATVCSYWITKLIYNDLYVIVYYPPLSTYLALSVSLNLLFFLLFKTYKGIVRYSTIREIQRILLSLVCADALIFVSFYYFLDNSGSVSLAYCTTLFLMSMIGLYGLRILVVYTYRALLQSFGANPPIPVYIWGVDDQSFMLSQTSVISQNSFEFKGFISTDSRSEAKQKLTLPVIEIRKPEDLAKNKVEGILFTDEKSFRKNISMVETMLNLEIGIYIAQLKNIDNVNDIEATSNIRPIQIEDLLGRPEINISYDIIRQNIKGKVVLVTGAAGSIGSEIVRQLTLFNPKQIICLDQAETPLHDLSLEMAGRPDMNFSFVISNVRNQLKMNNLFRKYKPDIVYHAAAYKHVPMMERDPSEAIITNVLGTKILVDMSIEYGVEMFIMVSTDKAVNPTNIMGCSKRIAEIYVQSCAVNATKNKSNTKFVTTRFGNVLGSNGSVIPLFRKQIEAGGPITVTHPEITRYFMTIPEACRLVMEASVIGDSGYVYVFDMGQPVKIKDLATRMIKLAGLRPGKDIEIVYSGLRPGEKLYEELLNDSETTKETRHDKIMMAKVREYQFDEVLSAIDEIIARAEADDKYGMITLMTNLVPEYASTNPEFKVANAHPND